MSVNRFKLTGPVYHKSGGKGKYIMKSIISVFCRATGLSVFIAFCSCQKVMNIDLNSASPQLVVEGNITDGPGPYLVRLSQSVNFDEITQIPVVTDAVVEISDSTSGVRETFKGSPAGIYRSVLIKGIPGHRYNLMIRTDCQVYEAVSEMPYPVDFSSLEIIRERGGDSPFDRGNSVNYRVNFEINDPPEYKNYYRIIVYHNGREISSRRVFDDQFNNGKIIANDFELRDSTDFNPGDSIRIQLMNIDKGTFNFFRTLRNAAGGVSFLSASPANPISNISNNGLGYFSASSVRSRSLTIPN
jgi:Domain of unknown function (DUF4249)